MTTTWSIRTTVEVSWGKRKRPETYKTPLQDAFRIVHDENNKIIYILANSGKLIPATFWKPRKSI